MIMLLHLTMVDDVFYTYIIFVSGSKEKVKSEIYCLFLWCITFAFQHVIFILNLQIVLKLKKKLFFKNSLKIGSQNYLFKCYLIFVLTCNFVSRRHLLLLHTGKTHDTKCNDRFCPQSHAITRVKNQWWSESGHLKIFTQFRSPVFLSHE